MGKGFLGLGSLKSSRSDCLERSLLMESTFLSAFLGLRSSMSSRSGSRLELRLFFSEKEWPPLDSSLSCLIPFLAVSNMWKSS